MTIHNIPEYAANKLYWVVREVDDEYWFYGAWNNENEAEEAAFEIGGEVILNN